MTARSRARDTAARMFHMKPDHERFFDVLGTSVHVVLGEPEQVADVPGDHERRDGPLPTIVLCGGLAATWHDWIDVTPLLTAAGFRTVTIERPGFGASEPLPPGRVPTVRDEAQRIADVLDALGRPAPVVLVGHSMAGFYVEAFARLFPGRTAGLVLVDSSIEKSPSPLLPHRIRIPAARTLAHLASESGVQRLLADPVRRALAPAVPPDGYAPERIDDLRRIFRRRSYLEAAAVEYAAYPDLAAELNALRRHTPVPDMPVIVAAAHSAHATAWGARRLRRHRRLSRYLGGRFAVVSPSHHHAMIDQPHRVARLIEIAATPAAERTME